MKKFILIILFLFLNNCSLDTKSGIWTQDKQIRKSSIDTIKLFQEKKIHTKEFNANLSYELSDKIKINGNYDNNTNNRGLVDFEKNIKKFSKFKFRKIDNFFYFEPDLVSDGKNFVFFDDKLNLFNFDKNFSLIWKKNFYSKKEIKNKPYLSISKLLNFLVITDTLGNIYKIEFKTGEIIWKKKNPHPFNSKIKIYNDRIFVIDLSNVLRCFSLENGDELWTYNSENIFLKSDKRKSIAVKDNKVFFDNSIGDITAIDVNDGSLIWQTPTQNTAMYENAYSLENSQLVISNEDLFFSNNKNEFFSLNTSNGFIKWKQNINSTVTPVIIEDNIFTISIEGYLFVIDKTNGNIIRITDIFKYFKPKKRNKIYPVGFIIGKKNIFVSTSNGILLDVDLNTGKTISILEISNNLISTPFVFDRKIFIVKNNAIIKLN